MPEDPIAGDKVVQNPNLQELFVIHSKKIQ